MRISSLVSMPSVVLRVVTCFTAVLILTSIPSSSSAPYEEKWLTQTLDHFNPQSTSTFQQKYLINTDHFQPAKNGVRSTVIVYTGNEGAIEVFWNNTGLAFDWSAELSALVVFIEHRYYGASLPARPPGATATEYFKYLTIPQCLADFAVALNAVLTDYGLVKAQTTVLALGGSYGGVLAALMRVHYPSAVDMALAASAGWDLLLAAADPLGEYRVVTADFNASDPRCPQTVRQGYSAILTAFETADTTSAVARQFALCGDAENQLATADQREQFVLWTRNAFLELAEKDYPYSTDFGTALPPWPVAYACEKLILPAMADPMAAISAVTDMVYNTSYVWCLLCWIEFITTVLFTSLAYTHTQRRAVMYECERAVPALSRSLVVRHWRSGGGMELPTVQ